MNVYWWREGSNMDYITLGLNIALAVFVGFGIIFGLIRGLRKTVSRGIFLIITAIILLFVTIPITNALLQIKLNVDMTIEESTLVGYHSINECVEFLVKCMFGEDFYTQNPEIVNVVIALPTVFINAIVYLLLFVLCKYLLLPLNYIFYRLTFAPKKRKEKYGFSSFDNDFDFDEVDKKILAESNANNDNAGEDNLFDQVENYVKDGSTANAFSTAPLHAIKDANEEKVNNDSHQVLFDNSDNSIETNDVSNNISSNDNENISNKDMNSLEGQFGKEGLFIKKEIETPEVHSVVQENFDQPSKKDLRRAKKEEKKKTKLKYKKHRLLGGLVGGFVGMFIMVNVCMPIYGIMNIARDVNKVKISNLSEEEVSLDKATDGMAGQIISAYDNSVFYPFSKYLGIEGLSLAEFDLITSTTVNNKKIKLRGDVSSLITTVVKADTLVGKYKTYAPNGQLSELDEVQLTTLLTDCKDLLNYAKKVNLVDCVADYIIPVACTMLVNDGTQFSDNDVVNRLAINALESLAKSNNINVFDETCAILDLAEYLNNQGLLIKIIKGNFDDPITIVKSLEDDFGSTFTSKLFELQTVKVTMPYVLNIALSILEQSINYGYVENDYSQSIEDIKLSISNFMQESINLAKSIDTSSNIYLTTQSLQPLGRLLQTVKVSGIVNNETYHNLIDYAVKQLQSLLKGLLPEELEDYLIEEFIGNIAKVDRWDEEMDKISSAILKLRNKENGILGEVVDGDDLRKGTTINIVMKESVFENIGESLDILEGTVLFGAVSHKTIDGQDYTVSGTISLFSSLLDYANNSILKDVSSTSLQKMTEVIELMKNNLITSKHVYSSDNSFWSYEMKNISTLVIEVYDMLKSGKFDVTEECGKGLDKAKNTTILKNDSTLKFMSVALDVVKDSILGEEYIYNDGSNTSKPQVLNDKIYELFVEVQDNLKKQATKEQLRKDSQFWQKEFVYYKNLQNIAENSSKLNTIDDAVDLAVELDNVMNSFTIPSEPIFDIVSFAIKNIKNDSATTQLDQAINQVIDNIADRMNMQSLSESGLLDSNGFDNFWQIEFEHLSNIMNIKFKDDGDYKVKDNLANIGNELDKVVYGYNVIDEVSGENKNVRKSYLLYSSDVRNVLASAIPEVKKSITGAFDDNITGYIETALNSIGENIENTTSITNVSFKKELTHMQSLANLEVSSDLLKYPTSILSDETQKQQYIQTQLEVNKQKLNALGMQLDSLAYAYKESGNIYKYTDKINADTSTNSKFITREIINKLIKDIFDIAKISEEGFPTADEDLSSEQKEQKAYNALIESIQSNIGAISDNDKVMSWQRELSFVNNLIKMNGGVEYTVDNVATEVGANLDAIAFNINSKNEFDDVAYNNKNECTYIPTCSKIPATPNSEAIYSFGGNSLFVSRESISTLVASYLDRIKVTASSDGSSDSEKDDLINSIIENCSQRVATTNDQLKSKNTIDDSKNAYYSKYKDCFADVKNIKNDIDTMTSNVDNVGKDLTETMASEIDSLLSSYQTKSVMGILLTRRLANLILHKIGTPVDSVLEGASTVNTYYSSLENYYKGRNNVNNNTDGEYYVTTDSTIEETKYPNPFKTLYKKIETMSI